MLLYLAMIIAFSLLFILSVKFKQNFMIIAGNAVSTISSVVFVKNYIPMEASYYFKRLHQYPLHVPFQQ